MNKYSEKYPNVILTNGLLDLAKCRLTKSQEEKSNKKLHVIAQIDDGNDDFDYFGEEGPIGLDEDPWEEQLTIKDIPKNILQKTQKEKVTINDLLNPEPIDKDNFDFSFPQKEIQDEELENNQDNSDFNALLPEETPRAKTWQQELREFFENNKNNKL